MQRPGEIENVKKKIYGRAGKVLFHGIGNILLDQWQWTRRGWRQLQEIQRGKGREKRTNDTPQGPWLCSTRKGSFWLCYAGPLAEKQKSGISDNRRRPKPIP